MIDDKVVEISAMFSSSFSAILIDRPKSCLDYTWPSIGTIDLLLTPLRGKQSLTESEQDLVLSSACYLAGLAHDCWTSFPSPPEVNIRLSGTANQEVLIQAKGGRQLGPKETFQVSLVSTITEILRNPKNPFPFFERTSRYLNPDHNLLSLFASGLLSGLCPYGVGPWARRQEADFVEYLGAADRYLSESAAKYYAKCFPSETIGASPQLYQMQLILPPAMHREDFPAFRAVAGLTSYLTAKELNHEQIAEVAFNLAISPDELISSAGFALSAAINHEKHTSKLIALSEEFGAYVPALRPSMVLARGELKQSGDWLEAISLEKYEEAKKLAAFERRLGFIPHLTLSMDNFSTVALYPLLHLLAWSQIEPALAMLELYAKKFPLTTDLILQKAELELAQNKIELAEQTLSTFTDESLPASAEDRFCYFRLSAQLAQSKQNMESAFHFKTQAFAIRSTDTRSWVEVGNWLTYYHLGNSRVTEASEVVNSILDVSPNSPTALINRLFILEIQKEDEQLAKELESTMRHVHRSAELLRLYMRRKAG